MAALVDQTDELNKQGATTDWWQGTLKHADYAFSASDACTDTFEGFDARLVNAVGDSGGPVWDVVDDTAIVVGHTSAGHGDRFDMTDCDGNTVDSWYYTLGIKAEHIVESSSNNLQIG